MADGSGKDRLPGGGMSSKDINNLADELIEETLTEAAGTFFGARKNLEDTIEIFDNKIKTLRNMEFEVLKRAGDLHYLLLDGEAVDDFYKALGVDPGPLKHVVDPSDRTGIPKKPKALTTAARYAKMVAWVYRRVYKAAETYMKGGYITEKNGRKRLTLNYGQVRDWCKDLNERIEKVNREVSPSETLAFVKKLDTVGLEKAKITGGGSSYSDKLDKEMAFDRLDCERIDLIAFPDLPRPDRIEPELKKFCKSLARKNKQRVKQLMDSL